MTQVSDMSMYTIIAGAIQCTIVSAVGIAYVGILLKQKNNKLYRMLMIVALCALIHNMGYLLEIRSVELNEALAAIRMEYIGGAFSATFFLALVYIYCGKKLPKKLLTFFGIIDGLVVLSVWTCESNTLYYTSVMFEYNDVFPHMVLGRGYLYLVNVVSTFAEMVICVVVTIKTLHGTKERRQRKNYYLLLESTSVPLLTYMLAMTGIFHGYDPMPLGIGIGVIIISKAVLVNHAFDLVETAHEDIIKNMDEAIVIVDYNYRFVEANEKAKKLFPEMAHYPKGKEMKKGPLLYLFEEDNKTRLEIQDRTFYLYRKSVLVDSLMVGYAILLYDITEERRQLERMELLKEEADRANSAKSDFLAQVSHEVRTPINAVLGMNEMILRESKEKETKKYAMNVKNAAKTLLSIINDILDSSKIESGKMELIPVEYELSHLLLEAYHMISIKANNKHLDLKFDISPNLPSKLFGDDIRVRQILINLLTNAVKYTPEGMVTLKVEGTTLGDKVTLKYTVQDTGIGMKEEDIPHLFKAFERVDMEHNRNIEGTGLGISITTRLLNMMDSSLQVQSVYGEGSTFSFELVQPVVDESPIGSFEKYLQWTEEENTYHVTFLAPEAKVLVVDDNQMNCDVFEALVGQTQAKVTKADSGQACLDLVAKEHFDVIFMDDMMPNMSGQETLQRMNTMKDNASKDAPVIMLTANAVVGAKEHYLAMGFDDFLTKPIEPDKLEAMLGRVLPQKHVRWSVAELQEDAIKEEERLPEIEGVDWDYASLHLPQQELIKQTAVSFYQSIEQEIQKLQELIDCISEEAYMTEYRIRVHTIKSTSAMLGILTLSSLAKMSEEAARDKNVKRVKVVHPLLIESLQVYQERLQVLCEKKNNRKPAELLTIMPIVDMIQTTLEERDYDSADVLIAQITECSYDDELQPLIDMLENQVMNLDAENGSRTASEILAEMKRKNQ